MSTQLTPSGARVIDPILTNIARGFKQQEFVGGALFPTVPVGQRGGKIITFNTEDFRIYSTARAPGSKTGRVSFGHGSLSFALEDHSIEGAAPVELMQEAAAVPSIQMQSVAIQKAQRIISLRLEKTQADLAQTGGNYGAGMTSALSGTSQWSDYTGTSNPMADVETAREAVRAKIGLRPNTIVMGAAVFTKLINHPTVRDRIKYTGRDSVTKEMLAQWWNVDRVLVGDGIYTTDTATAFTDIWGKNVILAYTQTSGIADMGVPTFGYTYQLSGYPIVEQGYYDNNSKTWYYPVSDAVAPVIAGNTAAYLYTAVVA